MRRIRFIQIIVIFLVAILSSSCLDDKFDDVAIKPSQSIMVRFSASELPTQFRSSEGMATSGTIDKIYVLVFDDKGILYSSDFATLDPSKNEFYLSDVPVIHNKVILHFIGYSGTVCDELGESLSSWAIGKSEGEIIPKIGPFDCEVFWQRVELDTQSRSFQVVDNKKVYTLDKVNLIRNRAALSFDLAEVTHPGHSVKFLGYALNNVPEKGTLAPFDPTTKTFSPGFPTEPANRNYISMGDNPTFKQMNETSLLFDKKHAVKPDKVFYIILKALFDNQTCYYKIGLVDTKNQIPLSIIRNHKYIIKIKSVLKKGYSTIEEAKRNLPASEDDLSTLLQDYTKISDGRYDFEVDHISFFFTETNKDFEINYTFKPVSGTFQSDYEPKVELVNHNPTETAVRPGLTNSILQKSSNLIKGQVNAVSGSKLPSIGGVFYSEIKISVGPMVRYIKVFLSHKRNYRTTPKIISRGTDVNSPVDIKFTISANALDKTLYPFKMRVESKFLNPLNTDQNMYIEESGNGKYYFVFTVRQPGDYTLHFKRNMPNKTEIVYLESDYFETVPLELPNTLGGDNLVHYSGELNYIKDSKLTIVPLSSSILAYPVSTRNNFRLLEHGKYVFDVLRNDIEREVTFYAKLKDGSSYKTQRIPNTLSSNSTIILNSFDETYEGYILVGDAYAYFYGKNLVTTADGISFVGDSPSRYKVTVPSHYPDNEIIAITDNNGTYSAKVSIKSLRTSHYIRMQKNGNVNYCCPIKVS
ncbi:hypothetical protein [Falsiporphyromonas endometrii]|uniref:Uncharacterized protein n=1 Tax=Falsiporphyromonas endometrii TaxID=1387297 RepID=A0ABV9K8K4_9PORP